LLFVGGIGAAQAKSFDPAGWGRGQAPADTAPPSISGQAQIGQSLSVSPGTWSGAQPISFAYQWQRCDPTGSTCVSIPGANGTSYQPSSPDQNSTLRVTVKASNRYGSSSAQSPPTAPVTSAGGGQSPTNTSPPTVSGTPQVSQTLTASPGSWSGTQPLTTAYQWLRCDAGGANCAGAAGATGSTYVATSADAGNVLRVQVTETNSVGQASVQSGPTGVVSTAGPSSARIYWGAVIDGFTYQYLYGGPYQNAPWDSSTWNLFESHAGKKTSIISWHNSPPWGHDFNYFKGTYETVRSRGDLSLIDMDTGTVPLRDIANGLYDSAIRTWAQEAAAYGHPFFLRLDWEMNGGWFSWGTTSGNQNTPADYVAAWRHFHDLASGAGATNVTWVWCPNLEFQGAVPYSQLYPGDAYVDWTCLDGYNKGSSPNSFANLYSASYNDLLSLAPSKPIMVGEVSSLEYASGSKASWITDALTTQLPQRFPSIKALIWFNWRFPENGGWSDYEIESSAAAQSAFHDGIASSYYLSGGNLGNLPLLSPIPPPS
jgi:hypothetical protein